MLRLRRSIFLSVVAAAVLAPAGAAPAATTAQRFADAVERGKSAIRAKEPEFRAAFEAADFARCERALEHASTPPEREIGNFVMFLVVAAIDPLIRPAKPVLGQIVADLDAIPTRDPVLRSGRAAWRDLVKSLDAFPVVERPCEQFERWARADWRQSARPDIDFSALEGELDEAASARNARKVRSAVRRLRRLGVSEADAERFSGDTLFDDLPDEITGASDALDGPIAVL